MWRVREKDLKDKKDTKDTIDDPTLAASGDRL
jgi:hypothetical protein